MKNFALHFQKFGQGEKTLLAFHGFGQHSGFYAGLAKKMPGTTIYSFDLPFHGKSRWTTEHLSFNKVHFINFTEHFLKRHSIDRFSLVAFSMGARLAFALTEAFPQKVEKLLLISPDGITESPWFRFATRTAAGNFVFRQLAGEKDYTPLLGRLATFLQMPEKLRKIAIRQIQDRVWRQKIYHSWMVFRRFRLDVEAFASLVNQHQIAVEFILAQKDPVIPWRHVKPLMKKTGHAHQYTVKKASHFTVLSRWIEQLPAPEQKKTSPPEHL